MEARRVQPAGHGGFADPLTRVDSPVRGVYSNRTLVGGASPDRQQLGLALSGAAGSGEAGTAPSITDVGGLERLAPPALWIRLVHEVIVGPGRRADLKCQTPLKEFPYGRS